MENAYDKTDNAVSTLNAIRLCVCVCVVENSIVYLDNLECLAQTRTFFYMMLWRTSIIVCINDGPTTQLFETHGKYLLLVQSFSTAFFLHVEYTVKAFSC